MRVLIDPQIFLFQKRGGVSRLYSELAKGLSAADGVEVLLPYRFTRNEYLTREFPGRMTIVEGNGRFIRPRALTAMNMVTRRPPAPVDVVHHTWYRMEYIDRYRTRKRVSTVYDMIPELMPETDRVNPHTGKREYLEASDAIVCISENTKADLLAHWGDFGKPVEVIHLGVEGSFFNPQSPSFALPEQFVLFVGRRNGYKNFALLAEAFAELAGSTPDLHLVCVGGGPFLNSETEFFDRHRISERVHRFDVDETDLPGVYAAARCLVFSSKYEGFGLPVLEAYASGCPVIIADTPCLAEVAGGLATVVPPDDPTQLAAGITKLLGQDEASLAPEIDAARRRAAEFTWARTCEETLALYRQIVSS
jgi:glycosyltransferase involved in cell wall biosynthesis